MTRRRTSSTSGEAEHEPPLGSEPATQPIWPRIADPEPAHSVKPRFKKIHAWRILGAIAVAASLYWLARVVGSGVAWVQARPEYEIQFADLALQPNVPKYVRSGTTGLLERVRRKSNRPETLKSIGIDLSQLGGDFALGSPWIERVRAARVVGHPPIIEIELDYRRPIAFINQATTVVLDHDAVVLPNDDLDLSALPPLIEIRRFQGGIDSPLPGLSFTKPGSDEAAALAAALKLAEFVQQQQAQTNHEDKESRVQIVDLANGPRWLSLHTADRHRISWGEAPGAESPGRPTAPQKWTWWTTWRKSNSLTPDERERRFLSFSRTGIEIHDDSASADSSP